MQIMVVPQTIIRSIRPVRRNSRVNVFCLLMVPWLLLAAWLLPYHVVFYVSPPHTTHKFQSVTVLSAINAFDLAQLYVKDQVHALF